jgi:hypothetical protein
MMMMFQLKFALSFLTAGVIMVTTVAAQPGADYLDAAPATVYEDTQLSPQNMYV